MKPNNIINEIKPLDIKSDGDIIHITSNVNNKLNLELIVETPIIPAEIIKTDVMDLSNFIIENVINIESNVLDNAAIETKPIKTTIDHEASKLVNTPSTPEFFESNVVDSSTEPIPSKSTLDTVESNSDLVESTSVVTETKSTETIINAPTLDTVKVESTVLETKTIPNIIVESSTATTLYQYPWDREIHAFFYTWYGNMETDKNWTSWNHMILPHWNEQTRAHFPYGTKFVPPNEIGSVYYPWKVFSSRSAPDLEKQMNSIFKSGITSICITWWGRPDQPESVDGEGIVTDYAVRGVLDAAAKYNLLVTFHLEPYINRNVEKIRLDLEYIEKKYGNHPAFYRNPKTKRTMYYVYDSYHISPSEWSRLLGTTSSLSIRNTHLDADFIGLILNEADIQALIDGKFDGGYTYFVASGFSFGSTSSFWSRINNLCKSKNLLFIPSVGPGYDDTKIRPWNVQWVRPRDNGNYYRKLWDDALSVVLTNQRKIVSITSWNEFGEGTQIEECVPYTSPEGVKYEDYSPFESYYYLQITKDYSMKL